MSYLASLRKRAQGKTSKGRAFACILVVVSLVALAWWLVPERSQPAGRQAPTQHSPLRPVAQRVPPSPPTPKLQIDDVRQNGQIVEIKGSAECDATLMINGDRVPLIFDHCGFKHFLVLPEGPSTIAVTAQGPAGGVNTKMIQVNVE